VTERNPSPYWLPGIVQIAEPDGVIDLGPGHLDPDLLPVALVRSAYDRVFARYGPAALTYGENRGPVPLREQLARHGAPPGRLSADNVTIAAGTSSAFSLLARVLARPGDVVFAEEVSYDFGLTIFRDHGLRVRQLPSDPDGIDPGALARAVGQARAAGQRPAFLYLIPTFHNPTGALMRLAALTSGGGLNHLAALMASELIASGELAGRIGSLRDELRVRRDTLLGGLRAVLGDEARISEPGGGFFLWLRTPSAMSMLAQARRYGVGLIPGARFGWAGRDAIRVSYSFQSLPRLTEAIERLDLAWHRYP
jgi:DNA-binding transcriptional MocR family regulator